MALRLQIKTSKGQHIVDQLRADSTFGDLKYVSAKVTNIPEQAMKIFCGYPRKQLSPASDLDTLSTLNLRSGDSLFIEGDIDVAVKGGPKVENLSACSGAWNIQNSHSHVKGVLTKRIAPADNSCLFTSIDFVVKDGRKVDTGAGKALRQLIASIVARDSNLYSEAFLGKSNEDYCIWIMNNKSWGGAIEISILSQHYQIEIDVIDAQTGRIDRFGEDKHYSKRVFLLYNGIHYDPVVLESFDGRSVVQTKFNINDNSILADALELGAEAKSSRQYSNINSGSMKCLVCDILIRGQGDLMQHVKDTGHTNFSEV